MKYEYEVRISRVGERGQVTIPQALRIRYGVRPGQKVVFEEHEEGLLIKKVEPEDPLRALFGRVRDGFDVDRYLEQSRGPGWTPDVDEE